MNISATPKKLCTGCGACANICKFNAIEMLPDKDGFLYPNVSQKLCVDCSVCFDKCPINFKISSTLESGKWQNDPDLAAFLVDGSLAVAKEFADKIEGFETKAGYVDGEVLDAAGMIELASIPSKEGLIAKLLGSIQSPLFGLACVLQAYIDKQNGGEAAAE